jgi:hypothetical protein
MRPLRAKEEHENMTTEQCRTPEEEAYGRLLAEAKGALSEAARTLRNRATKTAYAMTLHNYCLQPQEYEEAVETMRAAAAGLAGRDRELLGRIWRAALAAAAVANQIANTQLRAVEVERSIREQDDLESRLDELEGVLEEAEQRTYASR